MANDITGSDVRCPRCGMVMYPEIHKNKCYLICFCGYVKDNLIKAIEKEEKHMARTVHKPINLKETKKCKKARFSINNVIAGIMVITFIGLVIWGFVDQCYKAKNYMDNFYERKNSTLVRVRYEPESILASDSAAGYIDNAILEKWQNGETIKGNITLYNPYSKGKSVTILIKKIVTIQVMSYKEIYEKYDPKIYR